MENVIRGNNGVQYTLVDGKLIESTLGFGQGRHLSLASLGKILRSYKTTKSQSYNNLKGIRMFYASGFAGSFKVIVNGPDYLGIGYGIGSVHFIGDNAWELRKAALKSSKVLA